MLFKNLRFAVNTGIVDTSINTLLVTGIAKSGAPSPSLNSKFVFLDSVLYMVLCINYLWCVFSMSVVCLCLLCN